MYPFFNGWISRMQTIPGKFNGEEKERLAEGRVQNLLRSLDKVNKTSELRQKQALDLIDDLKRANRYIKK